MTNGQRIGVLPAVVPMVDELISFHWTADADDDRYVDV